MDLTMTFTGICCFLQEFRRVVLLDARQPRPARNNAMAIIPSHYAYIRFPAKRVLERDGVPLIDPSLVIDPSLKKFRFTFVDPMTGESEDQIVCLLDQMQIALEPQPVSRVHTINTTVPTNLEIPNPNEPGDSASLHWVADMALIHEDMAYVDERYLEDRPPRNIAAFAVFDDLRATPEKPNKRAMNSSIKVTRVADDHSWEFVPAIGAVKQALAFGVTAEMTLPQTDVVTIVLSTFDPVEVRDFRIELDASDGGPIHIAVGNSPLDGILQVGHTHPALNGTPNYDFELFYELSKRQTAAFPIPICRATSYKRKELASEPCPLVVARP
jgi:hypothetical protein